MDPSSEADNNDDDDGPHHWRATVGLVRRDARRWLGLGLIVLVATLLELAGPVVLATIVDRAVDGTTPGTIRWLGAVYLGVAVLRQMATVAVSYVATATAWRSANELRADMAAHVLGLDHQFHRTHSPGELIERIDGDVTSVSDFLSLVVVQVLATATLVLGMVAVVAVIDWRLGVGLALYVLVLALGIYRRRDRVIEESMEEMSAGAALYGGIEERLTASEDLRANGAGGYALHRHLIDTKRLVKAIERRQAAYTKMMATLQVSLVVGTVLALTVGAFGVETGLFTVGTAALLVQYSQRLTRPLEDLSNEMRTVQKANAAMGRVGRLLAVRSGLPDEGTVEPSPGALDLTLEGVGFHYGDHEPILTAIDLHIPAGTSLGLIGPTGSGKTTLARLVARLVDATEGRILLGDTPLQDIPLDHVRRRVAVIGQQVELVAGTVAQNLTLFGDVPEDRIDQALTAVGLDHLVGRSHEVELGSGGLGLSAGEAQLVGLARVWLRSPDVIVLDEPTARVDPGTEQRMERALEQLLAGRTTIIVAHRLATLDRVDHIAVIEQGRLVEHDERLVLADDPTSHYNRLLAAAAVVDDGRHRSREPSI